MENPKILYVSQEIQPYLPDSPLSVMSRKLSQSVAETGREIRTFMPRFGCVNERRNQLHEVIRLSGLNIVIDDTDHPLLIKVASIQAARMQIYFIDNDDYFTRKGVVTDAKSGELYEDNDERSIFFARGVLETTKKLRWVPDVVHLHGWFTMMLPIYVKLTHKKDPYFANAKMVVSLYDEAWSGEWSDVNKKLWVDGIDERALKKVKITDYMSLMKTAIDMSHGVTVCSANASAELIEYAKAQGKPVLEYCSDEEMLEKYSMFYEEVTKE